MHVRACGVLSIFSSGKFIFICKTKPAMATHMEIILRCAFITHLKNNTNGHLFYAGDSAILNVSLSLVRPFHHSEYWLAGWLLLL